MMRRVTWVSFVLGVLACVACLWWLTFTAALDQLEERGTADLNLAADRFTAEMRRMRDLADLLADHPDLIPLVTGQGGSGDARLLSFADRTGAVRLRLVNGNGVVVAASDGRTGISLKEAPAFERALHGALGWERRIENGERLYKTGAPVFSVNGPVVGAVMVETAMSRLEENWPASPTPTFFSDPGGVVFSSNRADLLLTRLAPGGDFPVERVRAVRAHALWTLAPSRSLPRRALYVSREIAGLDLHAGLLVSIAPALLLATVQAAAAAALCAAFGILLFYLAERRRVLAERLQFEERANAALELRVAERTGLLQALNADLRREVSERQEAEAALRRAQADLVQAGKLSALGQMSAGISHELNQPLMAIQSFAENGQTFLERGKSTQAGENLGRISALAARMGRIIRNLRAFARQEHAPVGDVDLVAVVDAALEIAGNRLREADIEVAWPRPETTVLVRGGEVRLQQVVVNLIGNAIDAMEGARERRLELTILRGDPVVLTVRDTGPGIDDPGKIFDPFYTTKTVGMGEGMGLGLSISYGLVQSFGGAIRGRNHSQGGAVLSVELAPSAKQVAA